MAMTTTRNARSRHQRGAARAALETHRKKMKLQEDHLTALFTHLEGVEHARIQAGEQVAELRGLGLTLGEIAELTGEPANRLSWLSRLTAIEDEDPEMAGEVGETESHPAEVPESEDQVEAPGGPEAGDDPTARDRVE